MRVSKKRLEHNQVKRNSSVAVHESWYDKFHLKNGGVRLMQDVQRSSNEDLKEAIYNDKSIASKYMNEDWKP